MLPARTAANSINLFPDLVFLNIDFPHGSRAATPN